MHRKFCCSSEPAYAPMERIQTKKTPTLEAQATQQNHCGYEWWTMFSLTHVCCRSATV